MKRAIAFSVGHFLVTYACFFTAFDLGMARFDAGDSNESVLEFVTSWVCRIFREPGASLWSTWASKNLSNILEWVLCFANSILWGIVLAHIYGRIKNSHNKAVNADLPQAGVLPTNGIMESDNH